MEPIDLPADYLERVYAGVLGKVIGVYLGRPFEGWTHQEILADLGHIRYYVQEKFGLPLIATDDDISGTFTFVRALEEHDVGVDITAEQVGKTWLNHIINGRSVISWNGTERTAYLNLRKGVTAPWSGSMKMNGRTAAEQIGAQIYIDGWAMVAPANPKLAAKLAEAAASVSHDGVAVHAAKVWAAMEAEAFVSKDVDHLLNTGLDAIPPDSLIATLIADIRRWCEEDGDWEKTRQRIEDEYGYDKYPGFCHVVPNHGIMVMTLIYAGGNFHEAMHIVNTCGWDTDCNSGNVACLVAIMHGVDAFEGGPDWRGPVADRVLISSADGGYSINNAARIAHDIVNMGRKLTGKNALPRPKGGAQYHFTLPGSVQGFSSQPNDDAVVRQDIDVDGDSSPGLAITVHINPHKEPIEIVTPTFAPQHARQTSYYELVGSPLVYPGQNLYTILRADEHMQARLLIKVYTSNDELETITGDVEDLSPGETKYLRWNIPAGQVGSRPIKSAGVALSAASDIHGTVWMDSFEWEDFPDLTLRADVHGTNYFYRHSFVNGADKFRLDEKFIVAQKNGTGIVSYGTREWEDYRAVFQDFVVNIGGPSGVAVRVQGLNRYYALLFSPSDRVTLVKVLDDQIIELYSETFYWDVDTSYTITMEMDGIMLWGKVGDIELYAEDSQFLEGGIGLVVADGSLAVKSIEISRPRRLMEIDWHAMNAMSE
ncbi:ADP-ribosylation/Crystallin J1 [Hypoxylon rubiginosum]|uniref:ADP-ribosylation/Crystallin J1 n=1 Tax=Hypoxylon rubiginosum TaxID=110542 RepID=A0ACC0DE70_9PEZI|nr:ADP-ribosylation/Crystallin J1 [Hypoxylon rubiginosum]